MAQFPPPNLRGFDLPKRQHGSGGKARNYSPDKRHSLQAPETIPQNKMYVLVVCGTIASQKAADVAMFGDFMGIASTLNYFRECKGTYLSCFPLEEYFAHSSHSDIKFGENSRGEPLFSYSRHRFTNRATERWFDHIEPSEICDAVRHWIIGIRSVAKPGDVVNIFFECHGDSTGGLRLGTQTMTSEEVASLIDGIPAGVQVNCVGSHCHSGFLVNAIRANDTAHRYAISACNSTGLSWTAPRSVSNRMRNMAFAQPFVQSLAKCKLPGIAQQPMTPHTIDTHHSFLKEALSRMSRPQDVQHYLSTEQEQALRYVEELVFRDHADVIYDPVWAHRRRRLEFPTLALPTLHQMRQSASLVGQSYQATQRATALIHDAVTAFYDPKDPDFIDYWDQEIVSETQKVRPNYKRLLDNLYWRGRQQSAIFDIFIMLAERGFLEFRNLEADIDYSAESEDPFKVYQLLSCFSFVKESNNPSAPPFEGYEPSELPVMWLAIIIARNCAEPGKLFQCLEFSGMLGKINRADLDRVLQAKVWPDQSMTFTCNLNHHCTRPGRRRMDFFGSWLPHDLGPNADTWVGTIVDKFHSRWQRIESVYKEFYGFTDEQLIEESRQASFLWRHPELEPRRKHSGQWAGTGRPTRGQSLSTPPSDPVF